MRVAFRCDASAMLGYGHVMRCLTLADSLREWGAQTIFICRRVPGNLGEMINSCSHKLLWLDACNSVAEDATLTLALLDGLHGCDWLVLDHYGLDRIWEAACRRVCHRLMAIDDLIDRAHDCDLLLDQNLGAPKRRAELLSRSCTQLLGPRYALLRPQFDHARINVRPRDGSVARLLVFFGGADVAGGVLLTLEAASKLGNSSLQLHIVVGNANPHYEVIALASRGLPNVVLHRQVDNMAELMDRADLFVGAGGTSSWERCCVGLPGIVMSVEDNQVHQCESLANAGAHLYLGRISTVSSDRLANVIAEAIQQPALLRHMSAQAREIVDGRGADRVASRMLAGEITLRHAVLSDSEAIFAWRNHQETRRYALDKEPIPWNRHERWFARTLTDVSRALLIGEYQGRPVGVVRYDFDVDRCTVSIYVVPGLGGQGWGARLLLAGEEWLKKNRPDMRICDAEIVAGNAASAGVFTAVGFAARRHLYSKELYG